ncbi:hypothetical protein HKBW3S33_00308 [Candidatus Hakubella thermalkaliphila]|uniref:Methyltransferase type 11 domain-containing protein n=1 Tax=Candidatus Hakubella thermalkaliphila TaxID=2754717 RepID=A0A6V8P5M4_9ACTN|nr:hypothetical protein HKBW3S33_00308 [Candidatus Hakubella thermalkaliphila]
MKNSRPFSEEIADSLREIEPWPCFYRFRQTEVEILLHHLNLPRVNTILEIGCGIAFNAVLLSAYAWRYIATDLPEPDPQTHTRGMFLAQRLLDIVGAKNIELVDCSATDLSKIESESVDVVYSSYVLEHIPPSYRDRVMQEIHRVLVEGGIVITVVPNFVERAWNYLRHYVKPPLRGIYRVCKYFYLKIGKYQTHPFVSFIRIKSSSSEPRKINIFPPPHGFYESSLQELLFHFPGRWDKLHCRNKFKLLRKFTISWTIPWMSRHTIYLYEATRGLNKKLGGRFPFKYLGISYCIVAQKAKI